MGSRATGTSKSGWSRDGWENVDSHVHILWMEPGRARLRYDLGFHSRSTLEARNPKKYRHLREVRWCLFCFTSYGHVLVPWVSAAVSGWFGWDIREEGRRNQGLRHSLILVITPARTEGASRVLHPPRSSASGCRAKDWSATRSDSQRSHRRTRQDGHPVWGLKPNGLVNVWDGRLATTRRPFRFADPSTEPPPVGRRSWFTVPAFSKLPS
jgi:hypothetical protein